MPKNCTSSCNYCKKAGLLILPLRYAVVPSIDAVKPPLPKLMGHLGDKVTDIALSHGMYGLRLLREGYLYVLQVRSGTKYWSSYVVNSNAFLQEFDLRQAAPAPADFTCDPVNKGHLASCIAVDKPEEVKELYLLFTPSPMTQRKLKEYQDNARAFATAGKLQFFNPSAWAASKGSTAQPHSLKPTEIASTVVEWINAKSPQKSLAAALQTQAFKPTAEALSGPVGVAAMLKVPYYGRMQNLVTQLTAQKGAAIAVFDAIGITQELNIFAREPLNKLQQYLEAKDPYGVSNQQRLQSMQGIREFQELYETGYINSTKEKTLEARKTAEELFYGPQRNYINTLKAKPYMTGSQAQHFNPKSVEFRTPKDDAEIARLEKALQNMIQEDEKALAEPAADPSTQVKQIWQKRYESLLDTQEMQTFDQTYKRIAQDAFTKGDVYIQQWLDWFQSEHLFNAFDAYDDDDELNGFKSAIDFAMQSSLCSFGLSTYQASHADLKKWMSADVIDRKNIYMRGIYFNQRKPIEFASQAHKELKAQTQAHPGENQLSQAQVIKITKSSIDFFKKVDAAFGEYVRNPSQGKDFKQWELVSFHWVSEMTTVVFRKAINKPLESYLFNKLCTLMYARLGKVTDTLALQPLLLQLSDADMRASGRNLQEKEELAKMFHDEKKVITDKARKDFKTLTPTLIEDAQKKAAARIWPSLDEIVKTNGKSMPTNNYHLVRLNALIGGIEIFALVDKLQHSHGSIKDNLGIAASTLSIASIYFDTQYALAKSIREISPFKGSAIDIPADITRGEFKYISGALGVASTGCGVIVDIISIKESWRKQEYFLSALYFTRVLTSAASMVAVWKATTSYSAPFREYVAKKMIKGEAQKHTLMFLGRKASEKMATTTAIEAAEALAKRRIFLALWIARLNGIGFALTLLEIAYLIWRDNDLEAWCKKSAFRKNKAHKNFENLNEEIEALEAATQTIPVTR